MSTTTAITQKGQVTIPVMIRKALGLKPFDRLIFTTREEKIIGIPVKDDLLSLYGSVKARGKKIDFKKLRQTMIKKLSTQIAYEGLK